MPTYYVNKNAQPNGDHEVHREGCSWLPHRNNLIYLGEYWSCSPAVSEAKRKGYSSANGCYHCSNACHTS